MDFPEEWESNKRQKIEDINLTSASALQENQVNNNFKYSAPSEIG